MHFFNYSGLTVTPRKFQSLLWEEYGYFPEMHKNKYKKQKERVKITLTDPCKAVECVLYCISRKSSSYMEFTLDFPIYCKMQRKLIFRR